MRTAQAAAPARRHGTLQGAVPSVVVGVATLVGLVGVVLLITVIAML